nr:hypothetical protein [Tanacetum cinerariifolium]
MINMLSRESLIRGANVNSSMDLRSIGSLLEMSTPNVESSLSLNFRLSNGTTTSIWIGSLWEEMMTSCINSKKVSKVTKKSSTSQSRTRTDPISRKEAYTSYSNPSGFIYQNKDKQNKLMRIYELHKFKDGTLNDVRTTLDDPLKGIWMKYLPQAIGRRSDKERGAVMI